MSADILGLIAGAAIASGTPVLLAGTGEVLSERAGVVNLGLEGSMLMGAVAAALTANPETGAGSPALALAAGALAGAMLGLAHASLVVLLQVGMLASGICVFFIGRGLSAFIGHPVSGEQVQGLSRNFLPELLIEIPLVGPALCDLTELPFVGPALLKHDALTYAAALIALAVWLLLYRTKLGLRIRAAGEDAELARAQGVSTRRVRLAAVTAGSSLAGLGGAHIVLSFSHTWLEGVTAGRGWVAIGLVVLARWNPLLIVPVAYFFGGVIAVQFNAQAAGLRVSPYLLSMLPYVLTIVALVAARVWIRSSGMPGELGAAGASVRRGRTAEIIGRGI